MTPPGGKDLSYKIFGLEHMGGEVIASVFAKQITDIVSTLRKVDKSENGGVRFDYTIAGLQMGSAQIEFREKLVSEKICKVSPVSKMLSVGAMVAGARAFVPTSDAEDEILRIYKKLSGKSEKDFNYAMMRGASVDPIRVDKFLNRQVSKVIDAAKAAADAMPPKFFVGNAIGAFDGVIEAVDLKGDAPEARLVLSAGGKGIDCVLFDMPLENMQAALGNRVSATGRAIYEGHTGLPSRIEIRQISVIQNLPTKGLSGSLLPFEVSDWGEGFG